MEHGDAKTIGDVLVCGSEATMEKRLRSFADAGLTDFNARIVPLGRGPGRDQGLGRTDPGVPRRRGALAPGAEVRFGLSRAGGSGYPSERNSQSWSAACSPSAGSSLPLMVCA